MELNQEAELLVLFIRLGGSADRVADLSGKMSCVDGKIIFPPDLVSAIEYHEESYKLFREWIVKNGA